MANCDAMLLFLHEAFVAFSDVLTNEGSCWGLCKTNLQHLQEQWHQKGLSGANALNTITQFQSQIKWQDMLPDQFNKFYRFVFHLCREPGKRNVQMDVAVAAWRLVLPGRFRLLERWCAFAAASSSLVVTQDLWRQVLDFSRTVHEDLSNFDSAGSWAVLLDEFVEEMRSSRRRSHTSAPDGGGRALCGSGNSSGSVDRLLRQASSGTDLTALFASAGGGGGRVHAGFDAADEGDGSGASFMGSISPRCGSKRRGPDVDVVAEQLSAMPLGQGQHHQHHHHSGTPGQGSAGLPPVRPCGQGGVSAAQHSSAHGYRLGPVSYGGAGGGYARGSSPDAMAKRPCLVRHMHLQQHPHQQQQQQPQALVFSGGRPASGGEGAPGFPCGAVVGVGSGGGRALSSGHSMSCSTGSVDNDGSSQAGPVGSAAMDCWLQEQQQAQQQQLLCPLQHCPQRRAIKARRSGLSDIVKSAVTDALGF